MISLKAGNFILRSGITETLDRIIRSIYRQHKLAETTRVESY